MPRLLSWNVFHGRDFPPDRALRTRRSKLLRLSERNATHLQVNRDLTGEFGAVLAGAGWDVALLQECPPRWWDWLAEVCAAEAHGVLTSRNSLAALRRLLARANPDLIGSNEGGSNLTLVRRGYGRIAERRELVLRPGPRPERRVAALTRITAAGPEPGEPGDLCVANLHASAGRALQGLAEQELLAAAREAIAWAGEAPLILGGDLNVRPCHSDVFERLAELGLAAPTAADSLDHLLARGLAVLEPSRTWPAERREVRADELAIRLADHAPVEAAFAVPATRAPASAAKVR